MVEFGNADVVLELAEDQEGVRELTDVIQIDIQVLSRVLDEHDLHWDVRFERAFLKRNQVPSIGCRSFREYHDWREDLTGLNEFTAFFQRRAHSSSIRFTRTIDEN